MKKIFVISSGLIPVNWKPLLKEIYTVNLHEINISFYSNSLLSVVTETYFEESGLFFPKKVLNLF